jgi:hypothetical protein
MRTVTVVTAALLACALGGCAATPTPSASPDSSAPPAPSATSAPPVVEVFTLPDGCEAILPASRLEEFAAEGLVLLGGPGGVYGDEYLGEPSPEQDAGGITCIWGPPDTEVSSIAISVAPLSAATRPAIVADLADNQGLNETTGNGTTLYWQLGDRQLQPAILNALTADSWISIIRTQGGIDAYTIVESVAAEVHDAAYN